MYLGPKGSLGRQETCLGDCYVVEKKVRKQMGTGRDLLGDGRRALGELGRVGGRRLMVAEVEQFLRGQRSVQKRLNVCKGYIRTKVGRCGRLRGKHRGRVSSVGADRAC